VGFLTGKATQGELLGELQSRSQLKTYNAHMGTCVGKGLFVGTMIINIQCFNSI